MFTDLVTSSDAEIDTAFGNASSYVGSWKKEESDWMVLDVSDVLSVMTSKLDIAPGKEIKGRFLKPSFCRSIQPSGPETEDRPAHSWGRQTVVGPRGWAHSQ